jgi:hypothetical protein
MRKFLAMLWNRQNTLFSRETVPLRKNVVLLFWYFLCVKSCKKN